VVGGYIFPGVNALDCSWYVTGVGGTKLETTYKPPCLESKYISENAFGDPEVPYDPFGVGNLVSGGYWGSGGGKSIIGKYEVHFCCAGCKEPFDKLTREEQEAKIKTALK